MGLGCQAADMPIPTPAQARGVGGRWACLSNLTAPEIRHMLTHGRSTYGRGCLAEPYRILSGLTDERDLAALATAPPGDPLLRAALALTLGHLSRCVPLVLERPDSAALADAWFPQLEGVFGGGGRRENVGKAPRCPLSAEARGVLQQLAANEQLLYDAVLRRIDRMLASLRPGPARGL